MITKTLVSIVLNWHQKPTWLEIRESCKGNAQLEISIHGQKATKTVYISTCSLGAKKSKKGLAKNIPIHENSNPEHVRTRIIKFACPIKNGLNKKPSQHKTKNHKKQTHHFDEETD
jgi:hypothetical protein